MCFLFFLKIKILLSFFLLGPLLLPTLLSRVGPPAASSLDATGSTFHHARTLTPTLGCRFGISNRSCWIQTAPATSIITRTISTVRWWTLTCSRTQSCGPRSCTTGPECWVRTFIFQFHMSPRLCHLPSFLPPAPQPNTKIENEKSDKRWEMLHKEPHHSSNEEKPPASAFGLHGDETERDTGFGGIDGKGCFCGTHVLRLALTRLAQSSISTATVEGFR